jgi:hypothetical protein
MMAVALIPGSVGRRSPQFVGTRGDDVISGTNNCDEMYGSRGELDCRGGSASERNHIECCCRNNMNEVRMGYAVPSRVAA